MRDSILNGVVLVGLALFVGMTISFSDSYNKAKDKEINEKRETLSREQKIVFDAKLERCTKRSGSTPSCWTEADWDLFFLKYCQRIKCE